MMEGSGSGRPKNLRNLQIRIRNAGYVYDMLYPFFLVQFDVREVEGMTFFCPKTETEECTFSTKTLSQMTSHLRKHTRWVILIK
jgi:hypothetical protein